VCLLRATASTKYLFRTLHNKSSQKEMKHQM
jgi:hypothetical protein